MKWRLPNLHGFGFTLSVLLAVAVSMTWPQLFVRWGSFETKALIVPLIQVIMFGMGTTLSVGDFSRVLAMPWPVFVGILCQYAIMPFVGWTLTVAFGFEPMVAAGMILVGSAPGGVASNVINYLAGANVPLSVTMTAISTLLSPFLTPVLMRLLAGRYVPVSVEAMMIDILKMIVLPIVAGLAVHYLLKGHRAWLDRLLPFVSMGGICLIIMVITSMSRDKLLSVGPVLIVAVTIHNLLGYLLGYWGARALRLSEVDSRTVAVEVGMQNGGMASGLAISVLNSSDAGLAPAIFGPMQNATGSVLASFWRRRPPRS